MQPYEWMKEQFPYGYSPEKKQEEEKELLKYEAEYREDPDNFSTENIMHHYAYNGMKEKLFATGEEIIEWTKKNRKEDEIDFFIAVDVYDFYGIYHYWANEPEEAIKWFQKLLDVYPDDSSADEYLIASYVAAGNYDIAKERIEKHIAKEIADKEKNNGTIYASTWLEFGKFLTSVDMHEEALKIFLLYAKYHEKLYGPYYFDIAHIYYKLGDTEKAVESMKKSAELQSWDYESWGWLALYSYEHAHDAEVAEYYSLKCLELCKDDEEGYGSWEESIHRNMSIFFANADDFDKAFHYLKEKFRGKYGEQAGEWIEMLDNIPLDENPDEIRNMFQSILEFEASEFASDENDMEFVFETEDTMTAESQIKPADISALLDMDSMNSN